MKGKQFTDIEELHCDDKRQRATIGEAVTLFRFLLVRFWMAWSTKWEDHVITYKDEPSQTIQLNSSINAHRQRKAILAGCGNFVAG